ncbi:MAG: hypothetical protein WCO96_00930 [Actinomycetes bacterium]
MSDGSKVPPPDPGRLRSALLDLHRELLNGQVIELERATGRKMSPNEVLKAALEDPRLAWLRELSALAARLDQETSTASAEGRPVEVAPIAQRAAELVAPPDPNDSFGSNYLRSLQRNPAVVMAHRDLRALLEAGSSATD